MLYKDDFNLIVIYCCGKEKLKHKELRKGGSQMVMAELSFKTQENDWFPSFSTFASPNWHNEDK